MSGCPWQSHGASGVGQGALGRGMLLGLDSRAGTRPRAEPTMGARLRVSAAPALTPPHPGRGSPHHAMGTDHHTAEPPQHHPPNLPAAVSSQGLLLHLAASGHPPQVPIPAAPQHRQALQCDTGSPGFPHSPLGTRTGLANASPGRAHRSPAAALFLPHPSIWL